MIKLLGHSWEWLSGLKDLFLITMKLRVAYCLFHIIDGLRHPSHIGWKRWKWGFAIQISFQLDMLSGSVSAPLGTVRGEVGVNSQREGEWSLLKRIYCRCCSWCSLCSFSKAFRSSFLSCCWCRIIYSTVCGDDGSSLAASSHTATVMFTTIYYICVNYSSTSAGGCKICCWRYCSHTILGRCVILAS
jgi:hypothetical protein